MKKSKQKSEAFGDMLIKSLVKHGKLPEQALHRYNELNAGPTREEFIKSFFNARLAAYKVCPGLVSYPERYLYLFAKFFEASAQIERLSLLQNAILQSPEYYRLILKVLDHSALEKFLYRLRLRSQKRYTKAFQQQIDLILKQDFPEAVQHQHGDLSKSNLEMMNEKNL